MKYFILAMFFNHFKYIVLIVSLLLLLLSDVNACTVVPVDVTTVINCKGCK